jgi:hypothetical protein
MSTARDDETSAVPATVDYRCVNSTNRQLNVTVDRVNEYIFPQYNAEYFQHADVCAFFNIILYLFKTDTLLCDPHVPSIVDDTCTNIVTRVAYIFTWNASRIVGVHVQIVFDNIRVSAIC